MGSRLGGLRTHALKTYNRLAKSIPEEVVVPLPFLPDHSGVVKWPYSVRSPKEQQLPSVAASLIERVRLDEKLLKKMRERRGKKHEKLVKVCHRCFCHELGYRTKGFKKKVAKIFQPRGAFEYSYLQLQNVHVKGLGTQSFTRKRKIYGVVFEQTENIMYSWNRKEIGRIELATSKQFKQILVSQVLTLIPSEPPGDKENLKWLINRVVDLNFDFGPYTLPLRSVHRRDAKDVYPMSIPSKNVNTTSTQTQ